MTKKLTFNKNLEKYGLDVAAVLLVLFLIGAGMVLINTSNEAENKVPITIESNDEK